ncbi:hypothetical protein D3C71_1495590 [compost metagenome]
MITPLFSDPFQNSIDFFNCCRIFSFWREAVIWKNNGSLRSNSQFTDQAVMGMGITKHPACTMNIKDYWQRRGRGARGPNNSYRNITISASWHHKIFNINFRFIYLTGLYCIYRLATFFWSKIRKERRFGIIIGKFLRCWLKNNLWLIWHDVSSPLSGHSIVYPLHTITI